MKRVQIRQIFAVLIGMLALGACIDRPMKNASPVPVVIPTFSIPLSTQRDVDVLFVIDDSGSMSAEQERLRSQFDSLMGVLKGISGGLPNIHVAIVSTDMGTTPFDVPTCDAQGGRNGRFLKGALDTCMNPTGQNYIVDVEPAGCNVERGSDGMCLSHDCLPANCTVSAFTVDGVQTEPDGLALHEDDQGCPRCRNYDNESLEQVFSCMADLDVNGCGMEQHFAAMEKGLTSGPHHPVEDHGFLRENAFLSVVFISDEDDCSAPEDMRQIFELNDSIDSTMGPFNFRCVEFSTQCDEPWKRLVTDGRDDYTNCASRAANDPLNLVEPVEHYVEFLQRLKGNPDRIILAAIGGPFDGTMGVVVDDQGKPRPAKSCGDTGVVNEGAVPGVRLSELVAGFNDPVDMSWAYSSVCSTDYAAALTGLGLKIKDLVEVACITTPLNGCPDPAAANGYGALTQLPEEVRSVCLPDCSVMVIEDPGTPDERAVEIPACAVDYMGGHPDKKDPNLPVEACFHVTYNEECASGDNYGPSRGAEIVVSRRTAPPVGSYAHVNCQGLPLIEKLCNDGVDNDMDGLVDRADADCLGPEL